ncbi:MAG: hypothetical protein N2589_03120 [bacterium]|nr:hypothetical protein [bacterium]
MIFNIGLIFKFLFLFLFSFFLPGFIISQLFESNLLFPSSFIISTVILFEVIFLLQIFSIPITLYSILSFLTFINLVLGIIFLRKKGKNLFIPVYPSFIIKKNSSLIILYFIFFVFIFIRLWNAPLFGPDTRFRWNFLAERIFKLKNFSFYPPYKPEHFKNYFYPDSIPPLVSFSYLYVYLIVGTPLKSLTSILIIIQIISILITIYSLTEKLFGQKTALINQLTLFSTPFLFLFTFIGQEAGYLTLSLISTLYFIYCNKEKNTSILLSAISTSLGILSREYGWLFLFSGILTCSVLKLNLKKIMLYVLITFLFSFPWYLRTWIFTGNPFYSVPIGNLFKVNPVIAGILTTYKEILPSGLPLIKVFINYTFILTFLGIPGIILYFRNKGDLLLLNIILIFALWFFSTRYTVAQFLSLRILLPAIIFLSIGCAGFITYLKDNYGKKVYITILIFLIISYFRSLPIIIFYPYTPSKIQLKKCIQYLFFQKLENIGPEKFLSDLLNRSELSISRILTDNAYIHSAFVDSQFEIIPVWSPEVYFIFNSSLSENEINEKLKKLKINAVLYTNKNLNNIFLNKFPFFDTYVKNWQIIIQNEFFTLYFSDFDYKR